MRLVREPAPGRPNRAVDLDTPAPHRDEYDRLDRHGGRVFRTRYVPASGPAGRDGYVTPQRQVAGIRAALAYLELMGR